MSRAKKMKNEFNGFNMGKTTFGDETGLYHITVVKGDQVGPACNFTKLCSGQTERELPEGGHLCGDCKRKVPMFGVIEYSTHFTVVHTRTGKRAEIGDGVDTLFDKRGNAIRVGSKGFREKLELFLNQEGTYQCYFPELNPDDFD